MATFNKGDTVSLTGTVTGSDNGGERVFITVKGRPYTDSITVLRDDVVLVKRGIPEEPKLGSIIKYGSTRYVRQSDGWHYITSAGVLNPNPNRWEEFFAGAFSLKPEVIA